VNGGDHPALGVIGLARGAGAVADRCQTADPIVAAAGRVRGEFPIGVVAVQQLDEIAAAVVPIGPLAPVRVLLQDPLAKAVDHAAGHQRAGVGQLV
jgi:hypothetical protein